MKNLVLVLGLLLALSAQAVSFECAGENLEFSHHMQTRVSVVGDLEQTMYRTYLKNYRINYDIKIGSIPFASFASKTVKPLKNRRNYSPTVYVDHFRIDFSHMIENGSGRIMFPYAAFADDVTEFNAYMMLIGIEDHAGGTIRMNCTKI